MKQDIAGNLFIERIRAEAVSARQIKHVNVGTRGSAEQFPQRNHVRGVSRPVDLVARRPNVRCAPKRQHVTGVETDQNQCQRAGSTRLLPPIQAERLGSYVRERLRARLACFEMVKEVRGVGLMSGIEFVAPQQLRLRIAFEAFRKIHAGLFGQMLVMRLFREKNILTQICGNNFMVLKVAPPLVGRELQIGVTPGAAIARRSGHRLFDALDDCVVAAIGWVDPDPQHGLWRPSKSRGGNQ